MKFHIGHFPRGSEVLIHVGMLSDSVELTVDHTISNGPNSFCVIGTVTNSKQEGMRGYNIEHVVKILKRGGGKDIHKPYRQPTRTSNTDQIVPPTVANNYTAWSLRTTIITIAWGMFDTRQHVVDVDRLVSAVYASGIIKQRQLKLGTEFEQHPWNYKHMYDVVNKKKLRATIKRIVSKCFIRREIEQHRTDELLPTYESFVQEAKESK